MTFVYADALPEWASEQVFKMLCDADKEFFPPLSSRESTTQSALSGGEKAAALPVLYFENIKKQPSVLAVEDGRIEGFMSLIKDRRLKLCGKDITALYLSTLIVNKENRGKGISRAMYAWLFDNFGDKNIVTRTWSSNAAHLKLLEKLGFSLLETIKNDRADGVDTVYFGRLTK